MFPLRDDNPTELTPYIAAALIIANVVVWLYVQGAGMSLSALTDSVCQYGTIPAEITRQTGSFRGVELQRDVTCEFGGLRLATLLTSMFLHGSWLHLIGNMWFLWLFGNNVEDSMGHLRFLLFYVLAGLAAAGAHVGATVGSDSAFLPTVGASGAISGVMGAYLVLYPRIRIQTLFIFLFFIRIIPISAWLVLVYWFVIQVVSGISPMAGPGVAFWAHIGGFVAGVALVKVFENRMLVQAKKRRVKLSPWEVEHRGWW